MSDNTMSLYYIVPSRSTLVVFHNVPRNCTLDAPGIQAKYPNGKIGDEVSVWLDGKTERITILVNETHGRVFVTAKAQMKHVYTWMK